LHINELVMWPADDRNGDYESRGVLPMRRIVASGVVAALLLSFSGCGGDADMGVPENLPAPKENMDMTIKIGKMKESIKKAKQQPSPSPSNPAPAPTAKEE
jgi:hypothetical protein